MHDLSPDERPHRELSKSFTEAGNSMNNSSSCCGGKMEYAWLEQRHDPIITDTNLAEIDFEDFRNEDLVYAFSCGEEESGGSSTDMSICRSEVLFSSTHQPNYLATLVEGQSDSCLIQDSLTDAEFNYSEQLKANKNHYTLTYSRVDGSMILSAAPKMMILADNPRSPGADVNNTTATTTTQRNSDSTPSSKYTTWSNVCKKSVESNGSSGAGLNTKYIISNEENNNPRRRNNSLGGLLEEEDESAGKLINRFFSGGSFNNNPEEVEERVKELNSAGESHPSSSNNNNDSSSSGVRKTRNLLPDLGFLENDVNLWDAFFLRGRTASKFPSILRSVDDSSASSTCRDPIYKRARKDVADAASLRLLLPPGAQKHVLLRPLAEEQQSHPVQQVCHSLSRLSTAERSYRLPSQQKEQCSSSSSDPVKVVKIKEAWAPLPSDVVLRSKKNLNLINNNNNGSSNSEDSAACKRRSYVPTDFLSKVLMDTRPHRRSSSAKRRHHPDGFPKSGSQNDLCDSWADEEESAPHSPANSPSSHVSSNKAASPLSGGGLFRRTGSVRNGASAEYPFQNNIFTLQQGFNFDLTYKRELFVTLYSSVERLLMSSDSSEAETRCILLHEFCPALHSIMKDGLKPEVITPFGRMSSTVWRVVEAVTRQGPSAATATCDLVMLLNTKYEAVGADDKKFAGFIMGLLNMSILHIWFSKLKWSMDILLRFYERHAYICALHKETRLLFDELNFCLQRLYAIPLRFDLSHISSPSASSSSHCSRSSQQTQRLCDTTHPCCRRRRSQAETTRNSSASSKSSTKSRIPRPISLPKRLEAKLGGVKAQQLSPSSPSKERKPSPAKGRKSRVKETIRLFDSKSSLGRRQQQHAIVPTTTTNHRSRSSRKLLGIKSPKTGAGEALAFEGGGDGPKKK